MSTLEFKFDWEDPAGARGEELRATWARLEIRVNDSITTRVFDPVLNSVRTALYVPLYPVAEWIVSNWWPLLNECQMPGRVPEKIYSKRHNLRFAGEGFAMPSLELRPTHGKFVLDWRQRDVPHQRLSFLQEGSTLLDRSDVEESLCLFVNRVVARLDDRGVRDTALQENWSAILSQDSEETAFCTAIGAMGIDPFDVSEQLAQDVLLASTSLTAELQEDFFDAADAARFSDQLNWVDSELQVARDQVVELRELKRLRDQLAGGTNQSRPWLQGYDLARELRAALRITDNEHVSLADLCPGENIAQALFVSKTKLPGLDGLTAVNETGSPGFVVRPSNELTKRFTFCRALFEFLHTIDPTPSLVSSAISEKQKRNRAFAAEVLAPAELIRERMSNDSVGWAEVEDLAMKFEVSTHVIAHQITNHRLGEVL
jgi:hypothetical protein